MWIWLALAGCTGTVAPIEIPTTLSERDDLLGIGLAPRDPVTRVGESIPFFATAYFENTEYADVTADVTWRSSDDRVATVGPDGVAFAVGEGTVDITATHDGGTSNQVALRVVGGGVQIIGVTVEPANISIHVDESVQLGAIASYDDGSIGTLGSGCTWGAENGAIASVTASALVVGESPGTTGIVAECEGFQSTANVEVFEETVDLGEPDLRIVNFEGVGVGTEVLWFVEVENAGNAVAGGFFIDTFLDVSSGGPTAEDDYDASLYVSGLGPGELEGVYLEMVDAPVGTFNSYATVDFDGFIEESDEGNNVSGPVFIDTEAVSLGADLWVTEAFAVTDAGITEYLIEIANQGDETTPAFWLDLYFDALVDPDTCEPGDRYIQVPELGPGATHLWDPIVNDGPISSWISYVFVDSCDDVAESDEGNNIFSFIVE